MAWLKIDDGFAEHERVDPLSDKAFRLHVTALCLCARKLTDGRITDKDARVVLARAGAANKHISELLEVGLWRNGGDGYEIRDYLDYNPSAEQVREERRKAAERMRSIRAKGDRT